MKWGHRLHPRYRSSSGPSRLPLHRTNRHIGPPRGERFVRAPMASSYRHRQRRNSRQACLLLDGHRWRTHHPTGAARSRHWPLCRPAPGKKRSTNHGLRAGTDTGYPRVLRGFIGVNARKSEMGSPKEPDSDDRYIPMIRRDGLNRIPIENLLHIACGRFFCVLGEGRIT